MQKTKQKIFLDINDGPRDMSSCTGKSKHHGEYGSFQNSLDNCNRFLSN